jgi:hypothetical protein
LIEWALPLAQTRCGPTCIDKIEPHPAWEGFYEEVMGVPARKRFVGVYESDGARRNPQHPTFVNSHPHVHGENFGPTVILYLQVCEGGGEFWYDNNSHERIIQPEPRMAVVCGDLVNHGVFMPRGDTPRIALIAVGYKPGKVPENTP